MALVMLSIAFLRISGQFRRGVYDRESTDEIFARLLREKPNGGSTVVELGKSSLKEVKLLSWSTGISLLFTPRRGKMITSTSSPLI